MSVRVNIEPAAVFKKPPVIQELLLPGWEYGTWDKGFALEPGDIGNNTLVYENENQFGESQLLCISHTLGSDFQKGNIRFLRISQKDLRKNECKKVFA